MKFRSVLLSVSLVASIGFATTLVALDVPELTRVSSMVIRGKVISSAPHWNGDHSRILTDTRIEVLETFKGAVVKSVAVMQPGGEVGDIGQKVEGVARFSDGEEVVVFLEGRGESFIVTGMLQGKYSVNRRGARAMVSLPAEADALLLDPETHQPVSLSTTPISLDALISQIRMASKTVAPVEQLSPKGNVAPKAVKP